MTHRRILALTLFAAVVASFPLLSRAQQVPEKTYQELRWRMIGPFRGGRTRAIAIVPGEPDTFYMGHVNGGVWKSNDLGRTWDPIFDSESTQSIGAIAVAPSDSRVIYVATGEGLHRPDLSVGNGIYRSADAGKTWTHLGLRDGRQIPWLAVDPHDPNRVFAAVLGHPYGPNPERGIFRSTDGGQNWQKVLYKDENTGGSFVALDPSNPSVVYASLWEERLGPWEDNNSLNGNAGGLFKSTDGGTTWRQLTDGLPKNLIQINVAIAASDPRRLYASLATTEKGDYGSDAGLGVYRSDDAGDHWYRVTVDRRPAIRIGGGDLPILAVDPNHPDVLYSASIVTMKSADGGKTWSQLRGAPGGDDYQNVLVHPKNSNTILLVGDQGAIISVNGGETWSSWFNQPTAQLYHVAVTSSFPYRVCAGQQESGSACIASRGNDGAINFRDWHPAGVIEYGYVAPDPLDPDVVYGGGRTEVSKYHVSTGQVQNVSPIPVRDKKYRADRTEPLMFSPLDPHTLYYATNILFKTTDGGQSWQEMSPDLTRPEPGAPASVTGMIAKNPDAAKQRGVIYSLAPSFKSMETLWAGTDDGLLWITRDGGKNWQNITPPEMTAWSKVSQLEASHFDDQSAYASISRFRIDDQRPYIYRTHDGGKSWQPITNGLPADGPVNTVREDPVRKGMLFAGTENAVWVSFDDGDHWQSLELNLPHTSMRDLWIHDADLIVATHGRSFWILDDISPLRQANDAMTKNAAFLFHPATAYRLRRNTNTDTPIPPDEPMAQNPPDGAVLDFYLAHAATGPVTIEILDGEGKLVRRYSSADKPSLTDAELKQQLIPAYWARLPRQLSTAVGMHRWVWDLRYPAPKTLRYDYPISAAPHDTPRGPEGPLVPPGQYTVRLTVDGKKYDSLVAVKIDPRVHAPMLAFQDQFIQEMKLAGQLSNTSDALLQARPLQKQLAKLAADAKSPVAAQAKATQEKLEAIVEGSKAAEATPGLDGVNGNIGGLYESIGQSDAAPTAAQIQAVLSAERDYSNAMKRWEEFKSADLATLNQQLKSAGMPAVQLEANPVAETGVEE